MSTSARRLPRTELAPGTIIQSSEKGAANGVATLDATGKLPAGQLSPSVVTASWTGLVRNPEDLIVGAITRDSNGAATSAPVLWPDAATGTYTATTVSTAFPGAVDAYTITHVLGGTTLTYTQPAVTRNANGAVTNRPEITVA